MLKNGLGLIIFGSVNDGGKLLYDTLVYSTRDGFSFVVLTEESQAVRGPNTWQGKFSSLPDVLKAAREAGLDPKACYTHKE